MTFRATISDRLAKEMKENGIDANPTDGIMGIQSNDGKENRWLKCSDARILKGVTR
jgi:hypothetical protein